MTVIRRKAPLHLRCSTMRSNQYHVQRQLAVDIRPVKRLAAKLLSEDSTLRHVLMEESDSLPAADFDAKLGTWLSILDKEERTV